MFDYTSFIGFIVRILGWLVLILNAWGVIGDGWKEKGHNITPFEWAVINLFALLMIR